MQKATSTPSFSSIISAVHLVFGQNNVALQATQQTRKIDVTESWTGSPGLLLGVGLLRLLLIVAVVRGVVVLLHLLVIGPS